MKSSMIVVAFLLMMPAAFAQKGIKGLVNAEKQFAAFTATHTIKEGFLNYMDSAGVIFRQGNETNAWESYRKQKPGPGILTWEPAFAVLSASGDMGITTGPYEFRTGTLQDTPVGRGSFSSIWHINRNGEWKNLADLGTSYRSAYPAIKEVKELALNRMDAQDASFDDILLIDKKFNTFIQEKNDAALQSYLAAEAWFNIDGQLPIIGRQASGDALKNIPPGLLFNSKAGALSSSKDLAYVYGTVIYGDKKENYLRAWIYLNKQWRVIMQTIKW
jgi:hypothetical protein